MTCALPLPHPAKRCGTCLKTPPPLDLCLTATAYAWPWVDLIARFKFKHRAGWAGPLATLMLSAAWVEDTLDAADWVLPIPLSAERLSERGYNQAWLLARQLRPTKADAQMLLRTRLCYGVKFALFPSPGSSVGPAQQHPHATIRR